MKCRSGSVFSLLTAYQKSHRKERICTGVGEPARRAVRVPQDRRRAEHSIRFESCPAPQADVSERGGPGLPGPRSRSAASEPSCPYRRRIRALSPAGHANDGDATDQSAPTGIAIPIAPDHRNQSATGLSSMSRPTLCVQVSTDSPEENPRSSSSRMPSFEMIQLRGIDISSPERRVK